MLERAWKRTCHTGYAQVARRVLREFYGENELTLEALRRMQGRLLDLYRRDAPSTRILAKANIAVRLEDVWPDVQQGARRHVEAARRAAGWSSRCPRYHACATTTACRRTSRR